MPRSEGKRFKPLAEGEHLLQIFEIGDEVKTKKSHYRVWEFIARENEETFKVMQNLFPWDEVPLLVALGYDEDEKGGVDWEIEDVKNKLVRAHIYHDEYEGKTYAKVKEFIPAKDDDEMEEVPF